MIACMFFFATQPLPQQQRHSPSAWQIAGRRGSSGSVEMVSPRQAPPQDVVTRGAVAKDENYLPSSFGGGSSGNQQSLIGPPPTKKMIMEAINGDSKVPTSSSSSSFNMDHLVREHLKRERVGGLKRDAAAAAAPPRVSPGGGGGEGAKAPRLSDPTGHNGHEQRYHHAMEEQHFG